MINRRLVTTVLVTTALSACAGGPDFQRPSPVVPEAFVRTDPSATVARAQRVIDDKFWRSFNDPNLSALIEEALTTNNDLRLALARLDSESAMLREARFDRYPTVTLGAETGRQRVSTDQAYGYPRSAHLYNASVNASWEIDLFGRVRRNIEAQQAESAARAEDLQALQISIVGEVASAYVDLRGAQERLRVARSNSDNQRETWRIVKARLDAGRGTDFDTARARTQYETTASRVPVLEAQIAVDQHRLAVLTGRMPEALIGELDVPGALLTLPARIYPGTPANLLRRRPDIAAAEERLHAATARVGVATADLFPRLSLSGMIGSFAFGSGALFKSGSETDLVALGIDWSFLDVGRVRARIAANGADAAGSLAQYQQSVLVALENTENALVRYSRVRVEDEYLQRAASESAKASRLAHLQFLAGAIDLYEVLDAERVQLLAQDAFIDGRTRGAAAAVALYKELAGGWPQTPPQRYDLSLDN
jgi:outer membrane protein, multidrug efflux system